jgi:hypothetical protein
MPETTPGLPAGASVAALLSWDYGEKLWSWIRRGRR